MKQNRTKFRILKRSSEETIWCFPTKSTYKTDLIVFHVYLGGPNLLRCPLRVLLLRRGTGTKEGDSGASGARASCLAVAPRARLPSPRRLAH